MNSRVEDRFAVVGMGGIFPGASDIEQFWRIILEKRVFIEELPADSLERRVFYRPEVYALADKADRSYTALHATIKCIDFDPGQFRIPPTVASRMDDNQKLGLLVAREAMANGALAGVSKERVSVFMGSTMIGQTHHDYLARFNCDKFEFLLREQGVFRERLSAAEQTEAIESVRARITRDSFGVTEDSAPGILPNIIAARISSVFDFHGHAYVVDAACASGLAAIIVGIQQLRLNEADAVVCGAADLQNAESGRIYFSGLGALSQDGSFPFDERASGFVVGDGAGAVVIKRLKDAIAAKDRIHAVITGYGQASDGKGKAVAAPNEVWQARTIRRAWEMAGVDIDSVELIEAHGTSTQVGDLSEVNALKRAFTELGAQRRNFCAIGSVKSNIGHLKSAAGIAGFLKAVLALDKQQLPPTAGFVSENPKLRLAESPFYVISEAREWVRRAHPRRAGVSAFGFGGADYHIALEEYRAEDYAELAVENGRTLVDFATNGATQVTCGPEPSRARVSAELPPDASRGCAGRPQAESAIETDRSPEPVWPQPVFFSAETVKGVLDQLHQFSDEAARSSRGMGERVTLNNFVAKASAPVRLAFAFTSIVDLQSKRALIQTLLQEPSGAASLHAHGIAFQVGTPLQSHETVALFPGQGSQYPDMLTHLVRRYSAAKQTFVRADALWRKHTGTTVTALIDTALRGFDETDKLLRDTQNTHPALVVSSLASFRVLEEMGLQPGFMVGHSVGEFTALSAAKRVNFADTLRLVHARATSFGAVPPNRAGAMLALPLDVEAVTRLLAYLEIELAVANVNSPSQTIVSGAEAEVERLAAHCALSGLRAVRLNVSHAFHSPLMIPAEQAFRAALDRTTFVRGSSRVLSNRSNEYYADDPESVRRELYGQITGRVAFAQTIRRLHAEGARLFVEVGPGSVLTQLTREILRDEKVTVISSDSKRGNSAEAFERTVCSLFAAGLDMDPSAAALRAATPSMPYSLGNRTSAEAPTDRRVAVSVEPTKSSAVVDPGEPLTLVPPVVSERPRLVYSGVSVGLPGSFKSSFRDDNFEQLFEGRNQIERLTDEERQRLVELQISKVVKSEQGASFAALSSLREVIQLAGKMGRLQLSSDYAIEEKDVRNMSTAIAHAVAAGYEALRDAQIPLVHEYARTTGGGMLPERWALPKEMQRHTGVIFANGFPMVDPIIKEVSRALGYQFGHRVREELFEFYDTLISQITDRTARKLVTDWYALNQSRLSAKLGNEEVYRFNHQLMGQIAMQANNRLARCINARGPNFQVNAACSSTSTAVTLAEDLIRSGRVKRMIVIGADDPTSTHALPYLGGGFLSTGACTNEGDLYEAALPFDRRRNGMVMGAGSVALVVELDSECARRGVVPVCELMGTHCFNTAGHSSQLDVPRYAEELENFMTRMEQQHSLRRQKLASKLLYLSHETYTPPRGGCAEAEAIALRHVFGEDYRTIEISNTKGMTGHTMGASIEDAVAAKALQHGKAPPVVNHRQFDPNLEGLKLSTGVPAPFEYALRMAAGFGSQGNYLLLKRRAQGENRISQPQTYTAWLSEISGLSAPALTLKGRVLVIRDEKPGSIVVERPSVNPSRATASTDVHVPANPVPALQVEEREGLVAPREMVHGSRTPKRNTPGPNNAMREGQGQNHTLSPQALVFEVVAQVTGYSASILEPDMELEADLGIDTVKQATVLATLSERLQLPAMASLRLSDYPTLRHIVEFCLGEASIETATSRDASDSADANRATPVDNATLERAATTLPRVASNTTSCTVTQSVLSVIAEVTGYPEAILSKEMELEADLGIDTVKQATILSKLADRHGIANGTSLRMSEFSTIAHLVEGFRAGQTRSSVEIADKPTAVQMRSASAALGGTLGRSDDDTGAMSRDAFPNAGTSRKGTERFLRARESEQGAASTEATLILGARATYDSIEKVTAKLYSILSELSPYPSELLESDLNLDSDLGLSAEAKGKLAEALHLSFDLPMATGTSESETLGQVAQRIFADLQRVPAVAAASQALGRQILALQVTPDVTPGTLSLEGKRVWLLGDETTAVMRLAALLRTRGSEVVTLVMPPSGSPTELQSRLDATIAEGLPQILVDLTSSPGACDLDRMEPEVALPAIARAADCRFAVFKRLAQQESTPTRIVAVTTLDGQFALLADSAVAAGKALYGLYLGFYKALRKEWQACHVTIVDLAPSAWDCDSEEALRLIELELSGSAAGVEVCHYQGMRYQLVTTDSSAEEVGCRGEAAADEVTVVTGGGAGITARILLELIGKNSPKVALVGRTPLDIAPAHSLGFRDADKAAEKLAIQQSLASSGIRVTPILIEREFARRERCAEIHQTLSALRALGCNAQYFVGDVTDLASLQVLIAEVRRQYGPITTLIHGAGIEVSHRLDQKTEEEFRAVHSVKSIGAYHLQWLCRAEPLRRVIAISSISGRYGNGAQLDYSAGNEFLNLLARCERRGGVRALSLLWSGWSEFGMAHRNSYVREHAEETGLNLICPDSGAKAAAAEILALTGPAEIVLHRGLGGVADNEMQLCSLEKSPLIDWVDRVSGAVTAAHRRFSTHRDAWLDQHRLAGVPLMPGVGFMEMMAETIRLISTEAEPEYVFNELKFLDGFKLHRELPRDVTVQVVPRDHAATYEMTASSLLTSKAGELVTRKEYASAFVQVRPKMPVPLNAERFELPFKHETDFVTVLEAAKSRRQNVSFGPLFNEAVHASKCSRPSRIRWSERGIETWVPLPSAQLRSAKYPLSRFLINPAFLDALHQAGAVLAILLTDQVYLPIGARSFIVHEAPNVDANYRVVAKLLAVDEMQVTYDMAMVREDGICCATVENSLFRRISQ